MKPTYLIAFLAILPVAAQAAPFDGPYIGLQAGHERFNVDDRFTGAGALAGTNLSTEFSASGFSGGLFAGYGKRFGRFYLGGEVEGSGGTADYDASAAGVSASVEHKSTYGATLRAGFLPLDDALIYGRLGVVRSTFDYDAQIPALTFSQVGDKTLTGLRLGLGAEKALGDAVTARMDWAYTRYRDTSVDYTLAGLGNVGTEKLDPAAHTLRIGLAYNF